METRFEIDMDLNAQPRDWILGTYWSELGQFRIERIFFIFIHFAITTVCFAIATGIVSRHTKTFISERNKFHTSWCRFFNFLSKTRTNALLFCKTEKSIKLTIATIFFLFITISPKNCRALGMHQTNFSLLQWQWYANSFTRLL